MTCPRCHVRLPEHELWCSWPAEPSAFEIQAMEDAQAENRGYPVR